MYVRLQMELHIHMFIPHNLPVGSLTSVQKFKQMRAQGVSQEDPEFVKIHRTLMAVQKQKEFQKQSQIFAQQQAPQRQQPNGTNGQTITNGVNGIISQAL